MFKEENRRHDLLFDNVNGMVYLDEVLVFRLRTNSSIIVAGQRHHIWTAESLSDAEQLVSKVEAGHLTIEEVALA